MSLIDWNSVSKLNVLQIDTQHKKLVDLINDLHDAMVSGKGKEKIGETLNELVNYTKYHFSLEESHMKKTDYPNYISHKALHDDLTKQVVELQEKFHSGQRTISVPTLNFLTGWLKDHISQVDTKFGEYLKQKNIKI